ncbi:MAG TPA: acetyl-CoA carboxylase biotin carboxyl carrier protein subunit [Saprospiraceae bacterium]|nr:acetyl-CoA carboxylase biotin carboxyl carrier protein subunit [Saprospiraceae bacterium]HMQ82737.1 acetyl-CoA carboxylase biotin carboxyl carrier protein subunit [Saprospiraceae bacterium]
MIYQVMINNSPIEIDDNELDELELIPVPNGEWHALLNNQSYKINVLQADLQNKVLTITLNGQEYHLKIEDEYDQLLRKMGFSTKIKHQIKQIKAPMPGLILDIMIEPGNAITKGTPLLILEAMKMENVIKSEGDGIVKNIVANKGQTVDKGQILLELD